MRTLAASMSDSASYRYLGDQSHDLDPTIPAEAKRILASAGGAKAAKRAISQLWEQSKQHGQGYLPTARLDAPMRVLMALTCLGVLEVADDNAERQTIALRFRLTDKGLDMCVSNRAQRRDNLA